MRNLLGELRSRNVASALQELLKPVVRDLLRTELEETREREFYDQTSSPLPRRRFLALVRQGALPGFRVGKRVLVRRAALHAYIERHPVEPRGDDGTDEIEAGLASVGLRRVDRAGRRGTDGAGG